ncbi:hypothetical protein [Bacillus sp. KH172YL63]|uniref:hypothetical protein n=1 Tax=Bacillus sp. KH172YL63 TaxID=2709784 RepID=UPI0013E4C72E|nr:hypothetical protein [Bacillus sp. KH172YL63]BCB02231.1 hypothetical protein KH172YL63_03640 [Bacillus sp. KH172YL63]
MRKIVLKVSAVDKLRYQNYMMQLKRAETKVEADTYYRLARQILEKAKKQQM